MKNRKHPFLAIFLFVFALVNVSKAEPPQLEIVRITPSGEDAAPGRQITFNFNKPVVPLGRMERSADEIPIKIEPPVACEWRWLNTSSLACHLDSANSLKAATRYEIAVPAGGFKAASGETLLKEVRETIVTERPKTVSVWFRHWLSPIKPSIFLSFNQPIKKRSLERHVFFYDRKTRKRYSIEADPHGRLGDRWIVSSRVKLPPDTSLVLMIEPGIDSQIGREEGTEKKDLFRFATFGDFKFAGVRCRPVKQERAAVSVDGEVDSGEASGTSSFELRVGEEQTTEKKCNPTDSVALLFTAPPSGEEFDKAIKFDPHVKLESFEYDDWGGSFDQDLVSGTHLKRKTYSEYLPLPLKSETIYKVSASAGALKDRFGRELANSFEFSFPTDSRPVKFHLNNKISVLEKGVDSHLPLVVTNLEKARLDYNLLTAAGRVSGQSLEIPLYDVKDIAYPFPIKIRDLLKGRSGVVHGQIGGTGRGLSGDSWFFSQVTPFHVHAKLGHYNSLVWVTSFEDGRPIENAEVALYSGSLTELDKIKKLGKNSVTGKDGTAYLDGLQAIDPNLNLINSSSLTNQRIFVRVVRGDDIAFLPIYYDFDLSYEAIFPSTKSNYGHLAAWGTTAQGIYKLGDTIQYKIYLRNEELRTFGPPPRLDYTLTVSDPAGNAVATREKVKLNEFGAFDGELPILKSWPVGWYNFSVSAKNGLENKVHALRVLVSDFSTALFKVETETASNSYAIGDRVEIETRARLHAGGPYLGGAVRVSVMLSSQAPSFTDPALAPFVFNGGPQVSQKKIYSGEGRVDNRGEYRAEFIPREELVHSGIMLIESAVSDDRGKRITDFKRAEYFSRDRFVGINHKDWLLTSGTESAVDVIAVSKSGEILDGLNIKVSVHYEKIKTAKVKSAGNAYLSHYDSEWVEKKVCDLTSAKTPVSCMFTPDRAGKYKFTAEIFDSAGRNQSSEIERYAIGSDYVLWQSRASNVLKITPEKAEYSPGETARYLVQNPFPGAYALITLERFGILESRIEKFDGSTHIIEVPVSEQHFPGFYLSAVIMSPRVDQPIENQVDLGKPSFRLGYAKTDVVRGDRQLAVKVLPQKSEYKPRDKVNVSFEVAGSPSDARYELAVAVIDQAVFDLIANGRSYFDVFTGFYGLGSLDVRNFNLLKQLVGRQKFEKKGANPGGGGGSGLDMRSMFKYVSYWNPSLIVNSGKAAIEFTAPDNLTSWKVIAMAVNKQDRMGLGEGEFKVNQAIEIRPALPNLVREGDNFKATFTLMNRTAQPKSVHLRAEASGNAAAASSIEDQLTLEPFKRELVSLPVKAVADGEIEFNVEASDGTDRDAIKLKLPVLKKLALETAATYGTTEDSLAKEEVEFPRNLRPDDGQVGVLVSPTVISGIEPAITYMKDYPYSCWEQILSKALVAAHYDPLKSYLAPEFSWPGAKSVVSAALDEAGNFQTPSGGMAFFKPSDDFDSPYLSAYTLYAFNRLAKLGYKIPERIEARLIDYLLNYLRSDSKESYYSRGMITSVRAVALSALAEKGRVKLADVLRFESHLPVMDLFGKSFYLTAATKFPAAAKLQKKVVDLIMSQSNQTGGKFIFSEDIDLAFQRILHSELRSQCAVLSALTAANNSLGKQAALSEEMFFKVVRYISQARSVSGRWENTQENIFCLTALFDYAEQFEKNGANFSVKAELAGEPLGAGKFSGVRSQPVKMERAISKADIGESKEITLHKEGGGRMYYQAFLRYSPQELRTDRVNSGITVKREYSVERGGTWRLLTPPVEVKQGELVRTDLYISLPAARNFVVVYDPLPGGFEPLNADLATTSAVDLAKVDAYPADSFRNSRKLWIPFGSYYDAFYHRELRHEAAIFYSEFLPAGDYHLSYLAQAIASGEFTALPLKAEEMYDPDVFGQGVPEAVIIAK